MKRVDEQEKQWLALPLGQVLAWLDGQTETLWKRSVKSSGEKRAAAAAEYEKVESLHGSLARVVAWLASMQPPEGAQSAAVDVPEAFVGKRQRPRGRVCFACNMQIRRTSELMIISPVQMPGLPVHEKCFRGIEDEFGGKQ